MKIPDFVQPVIPHARKLRRRNAALFFATLTLGVLLTILAVVTGWLLSAAGAGWCFRSVLVWRRPEEHPDTKCMRAFLDAVYSASDSESDTEK